MQTGGGTGRSCPSHEEAALATKRVSVRNTELATSHGSPILFKRAAEDYSYKQTVRS